MRLAYGTRAVARNANANVWIPYYNTPEIPLVPPAAPFQLRLVLRLHFPIILRNNNLSVQISFSF